MRIDIITALPDLLKSPFEHSIISRARKSGKVDIHIHNLREYSKQKHRNIDDYPFGGGAGMVLSVEPIYNAIHYLRSEREYDEIIYTAPDGQQFKQKTANYLASQENLILLAGHYKGVDQRVRDHLITMEISIGDYVLSGGELPAAVITDALVRLLPGSISDETSALTDSYQDNLLAPPVYTRPADFKGWKVPDLLLSGNTPEIEKWRLEKAMERTRILRPDLLEED